MVLLWSSRNVSLRVWTGRGPPVCSARFSLDSGQTLCLLRGSPDVVPLCGSLHDVPVKVSARRPPVYPTQPSLQRTPDFGTQVDRSANHLHGSIPSGPLQVPPSRGRLYWIPFNVSPSRTHRDPLRNFLPRDSPSGTGRWWRTSSRYSLHGTPTQWDPLHYTASRGQPPAFSRVWPVLCRLYYDRCTYIAIFYIYMRPCVHYIIYIYMYTCLYVAPTMSTYMGICTTYAIGIDILAYLVHPEFIV